MIWILLFIPVVISLILNDNKKEIMILKKGKKIIIPTDMESKLLS